MTSAGMPRDSHVVPRTKPGVRPVRVRSTGRSRASRMSVGAGARGGWWTAVLVRTIPRSCGRWRNAQPSEMGPPQSWATVTTGPSTSIAAVSASRSSMRSARRRTPDVRSE